MINVPKNPNKSENERKFRSGLNSAPCLICGKPVKQNKPHWMVHVHDGGYSIVTEEEAEGMDSASDLGGQPVGPECVKLHPELKPYLHRVTEI